MKAIRLLVLGALRRRGRAHGYQLRTDLESWGAHEWSTATSGSVYHALRSMTGQGLLKAHEAAPSEAGGPQRIEYELTAAGEQEYLDLLAQALSHHDPGLEALAAAVGLIEDLPREEALRLLRDRARTMRQWRASVTEHLPPDTDLNTWGPVGEVLKLWLTTADTNTEWTERLIRRIEGGAFTMAGEKPSRPRKRG